MYVCPEDVVEISDRLPAAPAEKQRVMPGAHVVLMVRKKAEEIVSRFSNASRGKEFRQAGEIEKGLRAED